MINVVVCIKQVLETRVPIQVEGGRAVQKEPSPVYVPNPRDVIALEEALHLKKLHGSRVTAVSLGAKQVESTLRYCLARGVDRAIHILTPSNNGLDTITRAELLGKAISSLDYDLVLCGNRSQDNGNGLMATFLADFLGYPSVARVVRIDVALGQRMALVWRQGERGWREEVECALPAVLGIERAAYEPGYVSTFAWEAASDKVVQQLEAGLADMERPHGRWLERVKLGPPVPRTKKVFVPDSNLSAEERFHLLISGAAGTKKEESEFVEGPPEQTARKVVEFLRSKGLIPSDQS